jgi:hypothetical protein
MSCQNYLLRTKRAGLNVIFIQQLFGSEKAVPLRGAPHYRIIATGQIRKEEVAERWYRIVRSGNEEYLRAGTKVETIKSKSLLYGCVRSYIKKSDQEKVPEEFEGVGRD